MEDCVPRLDVGLLSQQVMNTVSVTQSESAPFGTAASAPAVVAAAEGAGHFGQERKVPYRHASSPFLLFKLRRDPGNEPQGAPDPRIRVTISVFFLRSLMLESLLGGDYFNFFSISLSWLSSSSPSVQSGLITLMRGQCSCWYSASQARRLLAPRGWISDQVCHDLNGFGNSLQ
ncbi:hypothetical protein BGW80DRAFT_1285440 [Lactifluus volemus]|nr:hypothetical protein BGW80DRAFT_1285440 [Lactifluus volemus]